MRWLTRDEMAPQEDRLHSRLFFDEDNGCVYWAGHTDRAGYGLLNYKQDGKYKTGLAHRWFFMLYRGPVSKGLELDHLCRHRACCNPDHLEPVTHAENVRRAMKRRLQPACRRGHEFSPENTRIKGNGRRVCKACHRRRANERYHAKLSPNARATKAAAAEIYV